MHVCILVRSLAKQQIHFDPIIILYRQVSQITLVEGDDTYKERIVRGHEDKGRRVKNIPLTVERRVDADGFGVSPLYPNS